MALKLVVHSRPVSIDDGNLNIEAMVFIDGTYLAIDWKSLTVTAFVHIGGRTGVWIDITGHILNNSDAADALEKMVLDKLECDLREAVPR